MASYICFTTSPVPAPDGKADAVSDNAFRFEGAQGIPPFWLCLFDSRHIHLSRTEGEDEEQARPYLLAPLGEALELGLKRRALLKELLTEAQLSLYDQFLGLMESALSPYLLVIIEEALCEDCPLEYGLHMRQALETMRNQPAAAWLSNLSFENVSGLRQPFNLAAPHELVGRDRSESRAAGLWGASPPVDEANDAAVDADTSEEHLTQGQISDKSAKKKKKDQESDELLKSLALEVTPQRFHVDMEGMRAQELLYTIQVALAVQKTNALAFSPKGLDVARKFLTQAAKRSHISHAGGNKLLAYDRTPRSKIWGFMNIAAIILGLAGIGLALWIHWLWLTVFFAGLAFFFLFPDHMVTAFEFPKGYVRRGFKKIPFSEFTLAHFTITGKEEHLWASLHSFNASPIHIIVLSGEHREKYMLAFFCALWRLMFPGKQ